MRILLGSLAALTLAASVAHANCPEVAAKVADLVPADGATAWPTNGGVAFGTSPAFSPFDPLVEITSNGGAALSGALLSGPGGAWIFRPDFALSDSTTYAVHISDLGTSGAEAFTSFTTGSAADLTDPASPSAPELTLVDYVDSVTEPGAGGGVCARPGYWDIHVAWSAATDATPVLYALELSLVDLQPERLDKNEVADAFRAMPKGIITTALSTDINVPQNTSATVWVYAIDGAGRQSHSQPSSIIAPVPPQHNHHGCSCALDPRASSVPLMAGAISALLLVFVRRVRRSV